MKKFAIVLGAATFFAALEIVASSERLDSDEENVLIGRINETLSSIKAKTIETHDVVVKKNLANERMLTLYEGSKMTIEKELQMLQFHVQGIIDGGKHGTFEKFKCRSYFYQFERLGTSIMIRLEPPKLLQTYVFVPYEKLLHKIHEVTEKMFTLREEAATTTLNPDEFYDTKVKADYTDLLKSFDEFHESIVQETLEKRVTEKANEMVDRYISMGQMVIEKTFDCVVHPHHASGKLSSSKSDADYLQL